MKTLWTSRHEYTEMVKTGKYLFHLVQYVTVHAEGGYHRYGVVLLYQEIVN